MLPLIMAWMLMTRATLDQKIDEKFVWWLYFYVVHASFACWVVHSMADPVQWQNDESGGDIAWLFASGFILLYFYALPAKHRDGNTARARSLVFCAVNAFFVCETVCLLNQVNCERIERIERVEALSKSSWF